MDVVADASGRGVGFEVNGAIASFVGGGH